VRRRAPEVFHPAGIVFKGSGFYATDNRSGSKPAGAKRDGEAAASSSKAGSTSEKGATSEKGSKGTASKEPSAS
jgi:predicted nucleic acid-binding Zn ribbon protein